MASPLEGVRIADFTLHAAGPFCAHVLSLLGAEVIKIESAMRPDIFRRPHPVYGRMDVSPFEQVAANKRSITLNLREPRGVELAKRLVGISDMVIESFRPGVMERLGLGYDQLARVKPDVVMVSISAFGQTGPDRELPGYAPLFSAAGGLGFLTGYADGPPVEIRHVMDHSVGMIGAFAAMSALWHQRTFGRGQHVDVAAREVASAFIGEALLQAEYGQVPMRSGNASDATAPHGVYPCREPDSWLSISISDERQWSALVETVGDSRLGEPRFATLAGRLAGAEELDAVVTEWTRTRDADDTARRLQERGVAAVPSWNAAALASDGHLRSRGTIVDVPVDGKRRAVIGTLFRFSRSTSGLRTTTPALGEHNDYVFGDLLGLAEDERRMLQHARVIF